MNDGTLRGSLATLKSFVGGVEDVVLAGVSRCKDRVRQQESLCLQDKERVLQLLVRTCCRPHQVGAMVLQRSFLTGCCVCVCVCRCRRSISGTWTRSWWLKR